MAITTTTTAISFWKEKYLSRQDKDNTLRIYGRCVERFCRDFEIADATQIGGIKVGYYQDWVDELYEQYSTSTIQLHVRVISNFTRFLESYGIIEKAPDLGFINYKDEKHVVTIIGDSDLQKILGDGVTKLQDRLLVRVLLETGKRRGDIANIRISDVYGLPDGNGIIVFDKEQKTGKSTKMQVSKELMARYDEYILAEGKRHGSIPSMAFVFGKHGKIQAEGDNDPKAGRKNRGQNIYNRVNKICAQVGVNPKDITPHVFRHTGTTKIARAKGIAAAKDFGGWSSSAVMEKFYYGDVEGGVIAVADGVF